MCSSVFFIKFLTVGTLSKIFLLPSRTVEYNEPEKMRARWLFNAPTFSEIDISLSFKMTNISVCKEPAWFKASNAIPAVIAPSPITQTVLRPAFSRSAATAIPSPALIEVEEWPTLNTSNSLSSRQGKGWIPPFWRMVDIWSRRPVKILCG